MHERRVEVIQRQEHSRPVRCASRTIARATRSRGRQIARRIVSRHERLAGGVHQPRPFAAQRLRQQEPRLPRPLQRRRMKLDELEVGDRGPARYAIATPSPVATGGFVVSLKTCPAPPVASSVRRRADGRDRSVILRDTARRRTRRSSTISDHSACVRVHPHVRHAATRAPTATRPISRPVASCACSTRRALCAAFDRERGLALGIAIERGAPLHQLAHVARTVFDEHRDRALVAQSVARGDRVGEMQRRAVVGPDGGGDAALRVAGVSGARTRLRQHEHVAGAVERRGGAQRRDAAADNEEIGSARIFVILPFTPARHAVNRFERRGAGSHRCRQPQRPLPDPHRTRPSAARLSSLLDERRRAETAASSSRTRPSGGFTRSRSPG